MKEFRLRSFKAILFDLDSTLTDTQSYPLRASEWLLAKYSNTPEELMPSYVMTLVRNYRLELKEVAESGNYRTPVQVVKDAIRTTLVDLDLEFSEDLLEEASQIFKSLHMDLSRKMPSVDSLLESLQSYDIRMGIVTNSFEGHADKILKALELNRFFHIVVDGGEIRAFKPESAPFEYALDKLEVRPEDSVMIGDEFFNDMVGAKAIGLNTVWVNHRQQSIKEMLEKYGESTAPDLIVGSLLELENYI
ncbi:MAG: HAD family hydrolase [Candidatus Thorarchaeota archaeon]